MRITKRARTLFSAAKIGIISSPSKHFSRSGVLLLLPNVPLTAGSEDTLRVPSWWALRSASECSVNSRYLRYSPFPFRVGRFDHTARSLLTEDISSQRNILYGSHRSPPRRGHATRRGGRWRGTCARRRAGRYRAPSANTPTYGRHRVRAGCKVCARHAAP